MLSSASPGRLLAASLSLFVSIAFVAAGCGGGGSRGRASTTAPVQSQQGAGFQNVGPLGLPRAHHTATLLDDGRLLIVGGLVGRSDATVSVEVLDPATGQVAPAASLSTARMHHRAVLLRTRKVLVLGGQTTRYGAALRSTELFDPASGTWSPGPDLTEGRAGPFVAAYAAGRELLIAGGMTWSGGQSQVLASAEVYSTDSNTVSATQPMIAPRCLGEAVAQPNDQVLLCSGWESLAQGKPAPSEVWDVPSGRFIAVAQARPRAEAALVTLGFDSWSIAGVDTSGAALDTVERWSGQVWSPAGPLGSPRAACTGTVRGSDALLIGGRRGTNALDEVTAFPSGAAGPALADPRWSHTATLIGDAVYVVGGLTDGEELLASIEAWAPTGALVPGAGASRGTRTDGRALPPAPQPGALTITAITPGAGNAGTQVRLTGTGFAALPADNLVRLNGVLAPVSAVSVANPGQHTLDCIVPQGATTGPVTIQVGTAIATGPVFTVGSSPPAGSPPLVFFLLPTSGRTLFPVSITGKDFGQSPLVTINGTPALTIINFSIRNLPLLGTVQELVVLVPPGASTGPLIVHNGPLQSVPRAFTVR